MNYKMKIRKEIELIKYIALIFRLRHKTFPLLFYCLLKKVS